MAELAVRLGQAVHLAREQTLKETFEALQQQYFGTVGQGDSEKFAITPNQLPNNATINAAEFRRISSFDGNVATMTVDELAADAIIKKYPQFAPYIYRYGVDGSANSRYNVTFSLDLINAIASHTPALRMGTYAKDENLATAVVDRLIRGASLTTAEANQIVDDAEKDRYSTLLALWNEGSSKDWLIRDHAAIRLGAFGAAALPMLHYLEKDSQFDVAFRARASIVGIEQPKFVR